MGFYTYRFLVSTPVFSKWDVFYIQEGTCRVNDAHKIVEQVYAAKEDVRAADDLIRAYLPFIKAETAKFLKRPPIEGQDDELSITMMAFHEAIGGYSRTRGSFLKYAAMLIRSRLVDYSRREQRHSRVISLDAPIGEEDITLGETLADDREEKMCHRDSYAYISGSLYPGLREVRLDFALSRKDMIKDTVVTTQLDTAYMRGVQCIRDYDYETALALLEPYADINTAVAYVALGRNRSALAILSDMEKTATVDYMLALVHSRLGDDAPAVEHYLNSCRQDRSMISRGNLDPEIYALVRRYGLDDILYEITE